MPKKLSAGILLFRMQNDRLQVLLVHPGGPFWSKKDEGAWSIPKGEYGEGEDPLAVAKREFQEETGSDLQGEPIPLSKLQQPGGKVISAWAVSGDLDPANVKSNMFTLEWPPRSGRLQEFPEIDRAMWFDLPTAKSKLLAGQQPFLDQLQRLVSSAGSLANSAPCDQ
ncbi:Phosphohydrolase [Nitrospira sp. KM1]|uniref:NUDIX domain-containing protein n=1 Tax=Nitrospira sp. KM1 TaxID=1936990 RepID=UPI0013A72BED|nr:NUDIX domain-containing protein [Nitrospira sp. KM1]BCA52973.1 Phosphohydrolase [Nitrospira sp. KM1]